MGLVDNMGTGIGGWGLGSTMGVGGEKRGKFVRDRWGWAARNSSVVEMLFSMFNKLSSFQARLLAVCC